MTQHLTAMAIDKVSLVDKGANQQRFAVLKQDGEGEPEHVTDERSLVAKVLTVINERLQPVPEDPPPPQDPEVAKAGRKISGKRLSAIKTAMSTLYDIVEEVEPGWWTPPGGNISKENTDMTDEKQEPTVAEVVAAEVEKQLAAAFTSEAFTGAITKAVAAATPKVEEPKVEKTEEPEKAEEPADDEVTLDTVAEGLVELAKRMDTMGAGRRTSLDGQDGQSVKKANPLNGIL